MFLSSFLSFLFFFPSLSFLSKSNSAVSNFVDDNSRIEVAINKAYTANIQEVWHTSADRFEHNNEAADPKQQLKRAQLFLMTPVGKESKYWRELRARSNMSARRR